MAGNKDHVQHVMVAVTMIIMVVLSAVHVMELEKKDINQKS
jgi:hypothetical protein